MDTELESRLLIIPQHTQTPRAHILKSHIDLYFWVPLLFCPASAFLSAKEKKKKNYIAIFITKMFSVKSIVSEANSYPLPSLGVLKKKIVWPYLSINIYLLLCVL